MYIQIVYEAHQMVYNFTQITVLPITVTETNSRSNQKPKTTTINII